RHVYGCGKWFHVARCTMTLEVFGSYTGQTSVPPQQIIDTIQDRRPDWVPAQDQA
ncbi:MAG: sarcosine oxidase subunit delta, partial [Sulfitobacter sp.]|nr:sarcosine oxidase subunit delta [Sulfitobacter sp.]